MQQKILVSGATGMLGKVLVKELNKNPDNEIYCVSKSNVSPFDFVKLISPDETSNYKFEAFFHCAAEVNVNLCEKDFDHAIQSNCYYASFLFDRVKSNFNFFISTDSVYEGIRGDYKETDEAKPKNNYAISKLRGEEVSMKTVDNLYVIRTNIIGDDSKNRESLFEWAKRELIIGNAIDGFSNIYFNPLSVKHLSLVLLKMLEVKLQFGIYNVGCDKKMSKYDFLLEISNLIEAKPGLVRPVEFKLSPGVAIRPLDTSMNCSKIKQNIDQLDLSFETTKELLITSRNEKN